MKRIAITACPYSGTKYTVVLLRKLGVDLGHEQYGRDGVVSWQHAHMGKRDFIADGFSQDMVLAHQTAHPLMVISRLRQITTGYAHPVTKEPIWEFMKQQSMAMGNEWDVEAEMPPTDRRKGLLVWMRLWFWWNKYGTEKADWFYRVEDLSNKWTRFLDKLNIERVEMPVTSKTINRKKTRKILSWDELYAEHPGLTLDILDLAAKFGYNQIPTDYLDDEFYDFPERIELTI